MGNAYTELLSSFTNKFRSKIISVFISNSEDCPCVYYQKVASQITSTIIYPVKDINQFSLSNLSIKKLTFFFVHGDKGRNQCFYFDGNRKIYIADAWWDKLNSFDQVVYFHVCNGVSIIENSKSLKNKLTNWVSYDNDIILYRSEKFPELDAFNKDVLTLTYKAAVSAKSADELKTSIEEIYHGMRDRVKSLPFSNTLIAAIGNNVNGLRAYQAE